MENLNCIKLLNWNVIISWHKKYFVSQWFPPHSHKVEINHWINIFNIKSSLKKNTLNFNKEGAQQEAFVFSENQDSTEPFE